MKKLYLSIAILFASASCLLAQSPFAPIDRKVELNKSIKPYTPPSVQAATSRWYDYSIAKDNYIGNLGVVSYNYLFPDTNITAAFGGSTPFGRPWIHCLGNTLDPTSSVFNDGGAYPGELAITNTSTFTVDSIGIQFLYRRYSNSVDTLMVEVNADANLSTGVFTGTFAALYSTDSIFVKDLPYNPLTNGFPVTLVPKQIYKVVLDAAFYADSLSDGSHVALIATTGLPTINTTNTGRYVVASNVWFKPGYTYSIADTLNNNLNYITFLSTEERGTSTFPYTIKREYNLSFSIPTWLKYNIGAGSWANRFIPAYAYTAAWQFENHWIFYKLSCVTNCGVLSVNDLGNNETASLGYAYPNPAQGGEELIIPVNLSDAKNIKLKIFNTMGQEVMTVDQNLTPGLNNISINTDKLNQGVYLYSLVKGEEAFATKRFTVIK